MMTRENPDIGYFYNNKSKKGKTKVISAETITVVDENGEIKEESRTEITRIPKEPPFIKLYLEDIAKLNNLPRCASVLMYELIKQTTYNGTINLNSTIKKQIAQRLNTSTQTIDNQIHKMVKKDIFSRIGRGVLCPNPYLFGKGEWSSIRKQREAWLKISYDNNNRKIKSSFA
jgi:hypothetical protein